MNAALTPQERLLRGALIFLAVTFAAYIVGYLIGGFTRGAEFPFVANSVTKDGLFLVLALIAIANLRRFGWLTLLVIVGHVFLILTLIAMLAAGETSELGSLDLGFKINPTLFASLWLGADVLIVVLLSLLYTAAGRARDDLQYLSVYEYGTVAALAEVLIKSERRRLEPDQIAHNIDDYLRRFKASGKWKVRVALGFLAVYPLLTGHVPFAAMAPDPRLDFVKKRFMTEGAWVIGRLWRRQMQLMIGAVAQLIYLCYYGDERTFASVDYKPFSRRPDYRDKMDRVRPDRPRVTAVEPHDIDCDTLDADFVIVGSGAAGAILAYELAARERSVLVLERGEHVDPSQFSEDEREMLSTLYADGALQLSRDLRFAVLQGMCVGGSTVVNNAVCFQIPDDVLRRWNDPECLNAGLDEPELLRSFGHVRKWLAMGEQPQTTGLQSPLPIFTGAAQKFTDGAAKLGLQNRVKVVEANIVDCLGCGYCNIGCKYGKKLSMLDTVLPWAQEEFPGQVRVVSQCRAERIETAGARAKGVRSILRDGRGLRARAREGVIVAAGAINSSLLLQRSRVGGSLVGKHLSFNMASPLTAHFEEELVPRPYDGLQISHYLEPPGRDGFVLETWFNPPAMQSLFMPGWFENHYRNMSRYAHMACAGVVVGTRRDGEVRRKFLSDFGFKPPRDDLEKLISGLKLVARVFFEAGATRVMPSTFRYHEFTPKSRLDELDRYIDDRFGMSLNSAHPQGGNAISKDADKGVVDEAFRVHGFENLFVCDASVFPSSITVNPQFTVMALAHYAASQIAGPAPPGTGPKTLRHAATRIGALAPAGVPAAAPPVAPVSVPPSH
jgi:choline dehydrogenase-like flavoprotein